MWCWRRLLRVPWTARRSNQYILKEISSNIHWKDWCWRWNSNPLATWCKERTHWKRPWQWERLKEGGVGDDTGWDGWMASLTRWTWDSRNWWWTRKTGVLQFMKYQRIRHDWVTELNLINTIPLGFLPTVKMKVTQLCLTPCDPLDYTVHGILQARILEWLAFPFSRWSFNPGIEPRSPALQEDSLPDEPQGKPKITGMGSLFLLQGIFPTQELNWGLLHCRWTLYQQSHQGSPLLPKVSLNDTVYVLDFKQQGLQSKLP